MKKLSDVMETNEQVLPEHSIQQFAQLTLACWFLLNMQN